jgi:hypothetical protein
MHAAVTQRAGDQLYAAIMTIQPHLAQQDTGAVGQIAAAIDLL